jgi:CheY-like chemotaxis protein
VADDKVGPQGARIRCQKCGDIFRIDPPEAEIEPEAEAVPIVAQAIVAEGDSDLAKSMADFLEARGVAATIYHDGGEALLELHRERPDLVILGAALPGIAAPAIAEIMRRNADLQEIPLLRVSVPDEQASAPEFDADHTLEPGDLPDGLGALLDEMDIGSEPAVPREKPARTEKPAAPKPSASAEKPASGTPEIKAAERLARIVISDIVLYNEDKFVEAALAGNASEALAVELEEAGAMFRERVSEELRAERDFLIEELERRAGKRREQELNA